MVSAQSLDHDPEFVGRPSALRELMAAVGLGGSRHTDPALSALNALKRKLQVKRAERTYVVDVSVTSQDPVKAARIARCGCAGLPGGTNGHQVRCRPADFAVVVRPSQRAQGSRARGRGSRRDVQGPSQHPWRQRTAGRRTAAFGIEQSTRRSARPRGGGKSRLDQVERLQLSEEETGAFPEAVQSQTITALRSQYAEVMRREAEQMTSLGQRHPAVIEIQAEAARLQKMIEDEVHRLALAARSEYESARANEAALAASLRDA